MRRLIFHALLLWSAAGCNSPMKAADYGAVVFNDPRFAGTNLNAYACSTCHAVKENDTRLLAGHALTGTTARPAYWGGQIERLFDAVNFCYLQYMWGIKPLTVDEPRSRALYEYLHTLPPSSTEGVLPFTVVHTVAALPAGEAQRGKTTYELACQGCHGALHSGSGRLTTRANILPEVTQDYPALFPNVAPSLVVIEKVRHGNAFGVGGSMPLFSKEALSDEQLADVLAYLGLNP